MSNSVRPHGLQPTRLLRPWDSPGKNTGVGCHFLLQCLKVESESEVAQSCPTLSDPMDAAYQAPPSMGFSRQQYWSGMPYNYFFSRYLICKYVLCKKRKKDWQFFFFFLTYTCHVFQQFYLPKRNKSVSPCKDLHSDVNRSFI